MARAAMARNHSSYLWKISSLLLICLLLLSYASIEAKKSSSTSSPAAATTEKPVEKKTNQAAQPNQTPSQPGKVEKVTKEEKAEKAKEAKRKKIKTRLASLSNLNSNLKAERLKRKTNRSKRIQTKVKLRSQFISNRREITNPEALRRGDKNLKWLLKQVEKAKPMNKVLNFDDSDFNSRIFTAPRPYSVFLVITALDSQYKCTQCGTVQSIQRKLARLYNEQILPKLNHTEYTATTLNFMQNYMKQDTSVADPQWNDFEKQVKQAEEDLKKQLPMFFVQLDIEAARQTFTALSIQTAPLIYVLPPAFSPVLASKQLSNFLKSQPGRNKFQQTANSVTLPQLSSFLSGFIEGQLDVADDKSASELRLIEPIRQKFASFDPIFKVYLSVMASLVGLLVVSLLAKQYLPYFKSQRATREKMTQEANARRRAAGLDVLLGPVNNYNIAAWSLSGLNPFKLWCITVTWLFYLWASGGGMYNIIKESRLDGDNQTFYGYFTNFLNNIYPSMGDQFVVETYTIGSSYILLAASIVLLNSLAFRSKSINPKQNKSLELAQNVAQYLFSVIFSPLLLLYVFHWLLRQNVAIYAKKNGQYLNTIWSQFADLGIEQYISNAFWKVWNNLFEWAESFVVHPSLNKLYNFPLLVWFKPYNFIWWFKTNYRWISNDRYRSVVAVLIIVAVIYFQIIARIRSFLTNRKR
jgi:hypothetical protein